MAARTATPTRINGIATVLVPVTDQDRALAFYTERLGFAKTMDFTFQQTRWVEVSPGSGPSTLALASGGEDRHPGVDTVIRLTREAPGADHAALKDAGIEV